MILSQPQRVITRLMVTLSAYLSISLLLHFFFFGLGLSQQNDNGGNREYHYERLAHRVIASEVEDYRGDIVHGVGLCKVLLDDCGSRAVGLGTHEELLKVCEVYREIYESQYKKEAQ